MGRGSRGPQPAGSSQPAVPPTRDPQSSQAQLVCWGHRERTELDQGPGPGRCFYCNLGFEIHITNTQGLLLISDAKTEVRKVGRGN